MAGVPELRLIRFDAGKRLVYVIGGEGAMEGFQERDPDHYQSVAKRDGHGRTIALKRKSSMNVAISIG